MSETTATGPSVREVLAAAVAALGGHERAGQVAMAEAVADAFDSGRHLLVQAGTGTGKSLAYLVPALLHKERVVIATATLALQHQLVERDLPALVKATKKVLPKRATFAVLKGRSNYACLHRIREGVPDEEQGILVDVDAPSSRGSPLGKEVLKLRTWAEEQAGAGASGERDNAPRHTERSWRQVSVTHRECLGATNCPFGVECFAERAKERAHASQLIVTNHSLLSIDAIEGIPMIPDYAAVVVDEAHELTARVTQAATDELSVADVDRAARRARRFVEGTEAELLGEAADALGAVLGLGEAGRIDVPSDELRTVLGIVRDTARSCVSAIGRDPDGQAVDAARVAARGAAQEVFVTAERMATFADSDVLWLTEPGDRLPARLCVAPLRVWGQMREKLLKDRVVVFTSATLRLGGDFGAVAASLGLRPDEEEGVGVGKGSPAIEAAGSETAQGIGGADKPVAWRSLDVGSPFDYGRQGILYVARHLPPPGRDGLGQSQLDEIVGLVDAAQGGTLGLFSSRRAAEAAAEEVRRRLPHLTTLAQGDAQLPELAKQFVADPYTSLFGTLSLWQGLDVPGATCRLVLIDRVPFPRPDDPLMSARARAADASGGNGFMQVSATHAALLLAQGAGRLIRTTSDRGVVAVLDPRLVTARYGSFLRASLPPMWSTTDRELVGGALQRLAGTIGSAGAGDSAGDEAVDEEGDQAG
ncbi:MAG: ATP-dependent DNA helicase [Nocardioides sp.]